MKAKYSKKNRTAWFGALVARFLGHKYVGKGSTQNLDGGYMKRIILIFTALTLTGCGIVYQPTSVRDDDSANVHIIHLTPETVLEANSSPYTPKSLPDAFLSEEKNEFSDIFKEPIFDPQVLDGVIEWRMPRLEPQTYRIGVGDVITLNMQLKESLGNVLNDLIASQNGQRGFKVQDDGAVSIPDIGRIVIGGTTLQEAENNIYQRLLEVGETPSFSIEITEFNSQTISVSGYVKSSGILPISLQNLYLDEAIYKVVVSLLAMHPLLSLDFIGTALSTKYLVQKYITMMILKEYCFKMVTRLLLMPPMNTIGYLVYVRRRGQKAGESLNRRLEPRQILLKTSFLKLSLEAFQGNMYTSLVK